MQYEPGFKPYLHFTENLRLPKFISLVVATEGAIREWIYIACCGHRGGNTWVNLYRLLWPQRGQYVS